MAMETCAAAFMELFVIGLVFGAATAQGKAVTKAVAKGYMAVSEKTREVVSTLREDMRGAIDEARTERDQDETGSDPEGHDAEALALREETAPPALETSTAGTPPTMAATPKIKSKQSPTVMKSLAKRYMEMTEKTRDAVSGIRENVRDAIEEARYERELAAQRAAESAPKASDAPTEPIIETPAESAPRKKRGTTARSTRTTASAAKTAGESPKPARSTRTKTAAVKSPANIAVSASAAPAPVKRGRPKKSADTTGLSAADALLEVAEIAADAL